MRLKNRAGFTLAEVLVSTAIFSGLALAIAEIINQSNAQLTLFNLRQNIILEHSEIQKELINRVACLNTFTAANVAGPLGAATPAAPVNVLTIRDDALAPGNMLHTPGGGINNNNYLPRSRTVPPDHATGVANSKFFLQSARVLQANLTNAYVALNAETNLPPNSFYVEFRYRLNSVGPAATVSDATVRAFGLNGEIPHYTLFTAQFNGPNITECNASIEAEFDDILINADLPLVNPINNPLGNPAEIKNSDLDISGRLHVEEPSNGIWAERFYHHSDAKLKTNIKNFPSALNDLIKLRGVEFDWIKSGQHDWGLVAQEVEAVFPQLVHVFGADGKKSVSYDSFVAPVIESQKTLRLNRQVLNKEKNEIEKILNSLEKRNKEKEI